MSSEGLLRASIEVLAPIGRAEQELGYRINNTGHVELICGRPYRLERETSDGWVVMNPGMAFPLVGFGVRPGGSRELKATIPADAPAGRYRISTSVNSDHAEGAVHLSVVFDVVSND